MSAKIFLSTVSDEFRAYRDQLRADLTRPNVEVKVQEDFKDLGGDTLDKLDVYIAHCDAVVHLAGDMTGSDPGEYALGALRAKYPDLADKLPPLGEALRNGSGVSYTQWEAWLALYHGRLLFIEKAADSAERGPKYTPTDASRAAQAEHLARLKAMGRYPGSIFTSPDNLAKHILSSAILELLVKAQDASEAPRHSGAEIKATIEGGDVRGNIGAQNIIIGTQIFYSGAPAQPADAAQNGSPKEHVGTWPVVWHVPYARNPNFTGRSEVIARLQEELQSGQAAAVTQAIAGLGGIGKTQLALEYCYRQACSYRVVWWIRAESKETRMADLAALAERLELGPVDHSNLSKSVAAVIEWLNHNPGWLLIFDNVEHPEDLEHLLPTGGRGHVLITSRHGAWGASARTVSLNVWTPEEATQFLRKRANEDDTEATKRAATALAEALGCLPLAIEQAAAYIEESKIGISTYTDLFAQHQLRLFQGRSAQPTSAQRTIATVWDISIRSVERASPGAVHLLQLCAFMRPDRISKQTIEAHHNIFPEPLKATASNELALHDAIAMLRRYSLVDATPQFISVHRLVQLVVRDRLEPRAYRQLHEIADRLEHEISDSSFTTDSEQTLSQSQLETARLLKTLLVRLLNKRVGRRRWLLISIGVLLSVVPAVSVATDLTIFHFAVDNGQIAIRPGFPATYAFAPVHFVRTLVTDLSIREIVPTSALFPEIAAGSKWGVATQRDLHGLKPWLSILQPDLIPPTGERLRAFAFGKTPKFNVETDRPPTLETLFLATLQGRLPSEIARETYPDDQTLPWSCTTTKTTTAAETTTTTTTPGTTIAGKIDFTLLASSQDVFKRDLEWIAAVAPVEPAARAEKFSYVVGLTAYRAAHEKDDDKSLAEFDAFSRAVEVMAGNSPTDAFKAAIAPFFLSAKGTWCSLYASFGAAILGRDQASLAAEAELRAVFETFDRSKQGDLARVEQSMAVHALARLARRRPLDPATLQAIQAMITRDGSDLTIVTPARELLTQIAVSQALPPDLVVLLFKNLRLRPDNAGYDFTPLVSTNLLARNFAHLDPEQKKEYREWLAAQTSGNATMSDFYEALGYVGLTETLSEDELDLLEGRLSLLSPFPPQAGNYPGYTVSDDRGAQAAVALGRVAQFSRLPPAITNRLANLYAVRDDLVGREEIIRGLAEQWFADTPDLAEAIQSRLTRCDGDVKQRALEIEVARSAILKRSDLEQQHLLNQLVDAWRKTVEPVQRIALAHLIGSGALH